MEPKAFRTLDAWRRWLETNHHRESELLVKFYKRDSGKPSITWPESVDGALAFGWIDGVRRRIDEESYSIRFTPRKSRSYWSAVNIRRAEELKAAGLMHASGLEAFESRGASDAARYAYENRPKQLEPSQEEEFRKNSAAWDYFEKRPPWYRQTATWWVISAKGEETRRKRLATLIACSAEERHIPQLVRTPPVRKTAK